MFSERELHNKMPDDKETKVQVEYPCLWIYKIIGFDADEMKLAVAETIRDRSYKISLSHSSESGKYHSLNVELSVESESHRTAIYDAFRIHRAVKLVL